MARKRFAPSHTLTGTREYVSIDDSAWKLDDVPPISASAASDHAFWRYWRGETRFDLHDPDLAPFIDLEAGPETWELRQLKLDERQVVDRFRRRDEVERANYFAFLRCVVTVRNATGPEGERLRKALEAEERDEKEIIAAVEAYALDVPNDIGGAAIRASQDLTRLEKKPSASPPGDESRSRE